MLYVNPGCDLNITPKLSVVRYWLLSTTGIVLESRGSYLCTQGVEKVLFCLASYLKDQVQKTLPVALVCSVTAYWYRFMWWICKSVPVRLLMTLETVGSPKLDGIVPAVIWELALWRYPAYSLGCWYWIEVEIKSRSWSWLFVLKSRYFFQWTVESPGCVHGIFFA